MHKPHLQAGSVCNLWESFMEGSLYLEFDRYDEVLCLSTGNLILRTLEECIVHRKDTEQIFTVGSESCIVAL